MYNRKKGGTGFQPVTSFKISKRNLPHWQEPNRVYFLTWRCLKGLVLSSEERKMTLESLCYWNGQKWTVYAAVIKGLKIELTWSLENLPLPLFAKEG